MRLTPLLTGCVALGMLALALPYTAAHALIIADRPAIRALQDGTELTDYALLLARHQRALTIHSDSRITADLALLSTAAARQGQLSWAEAEAAELANLRQRPRDALSWARLAYVRHAQAKSANQIIPAVMRSIDSAEYVPGFMQWRLILALQLWPQMSTPERDRTAAQVGLLWRQKRSNLIRLARIVPLARQIEAIMTQYYPYETAAFLRYRRPLRHTERHGGH